ncbi:hypothetical protein KBK19_11675 [Microvirga sp. STR05]|uniref:SMI1/KNR4 family protein n=1 Tax=Hymenobacter duratus TaxID=2771356 RepID=A0ABR8JFP2_9BACT|nr:hypothetical protein [Hymenobacter duratus]MBD2715695.1 hypothetical protein [Hymenobacter duratus]MBR7950605.1 hypothetical protein [Microvirga sp. STR05]
MISTQDLSALPDAAALQRLCQSLAVLDAINSQDPEYRYYTYNPNWDENEALFEMSDGEGDQMLVLFRPEGCCINGFLSEYEQPDKAQVTRGLPAAFDEFMFGEPVSSIGTTFCLWYTPAHGWQTGVVEAEDDGSEELLYIFDGKPETYADWANEYFIDETDRDPIDTEAVARVYQHEPLTRSLVQELIDPLEDWPQLEADLQQIGYPYTFS